MSSKGAITITQDELWKIKMRANVLPNGRSHLIQLILKKIEQIISINRAKRGLING